MAIDPLLFSTWFHGSSTNELSVPSWRTGVSRNGAVRSTNSPSRLVGYGTTQVAGFGFCSNGVTRNSVDLDDPKVSRLPIGFGDWNPLTNDELSTPEDRRISCVSVTERKKPTPMIALQFAAPLFLGPKAANNVAIPVSPARVIIEPVIRSERQV
jgi:hypothetical protein